MNVRLRVKAILKIKFGALFLQKNKICWLWSFTILFLGSKSKIMYIIIHLLVVVIYWSVNVKMKFTEKNLTDRKSNNSLVVVIIYHRKSIQFNECSMLQNEKKVSSVLGKKKHSTSYVCVRVLDILTCKYAWFDRLIFIFPILFHGSKINFLLFKFIQILLLTNNFFFLLSICVSMFF